MLTDPISDMFTRIRNANARMHENVDVPSSNIKIEIAKILKDEGYILSYKNVKDCHNVLRIHLKYTSVGKAVIQGIKRISKSSLRVYRGYENMPRTVRGLGVTIVSTSRGLMTDKQAKKEKIGGEVVGCVW